MTFEEVQDMYALYSISPELTCTCDDNHICQQCFEEETNERNISAHEDFDYEG